MNRKTNNAGIDLAVALWLALDDYDYVDKPNYISVTTLIRPVRQIILTQRVNALAVQNPEAVTPEDIINRFASRLGQTIHFGVELSWKEHYRTAMKILGYPDRVINMVRINPEQEEPDTLPVFTEQRTEKEVRIGDVVYTVGGKIDLIIEGRLRDIKSTKVFQFMRHTGVDKWKLQGSLYRWLNPRKVTNGNFLVQYLLVDWIRGGTKRDPNYPPHPAPARSIELMGTEETDTWVKNKLRLLSQLADAPEADLPECSSEDLWRDAPVFKYYADPAKTTGRSTKNFEHLHEANAFLAEKGKGIVIPKPGLVNACNYCPAAPLCGQYQQLLLAGEIAA